MSVTWFSFFNLGKINLECKVMTKRPKQGN
jgi:hypothetical protein